MSPRPAVLALLAACTHADSVDGALSGVDRAFERPAIATSLEDATFGAPWLDDFDPDPAGFTDLSTVPRGPDGWALEPGLYAFVAESYCLKPGTWGPKRGVGDGYLYAPLRGTRAGPVSAILSGAPEHPEISQRAIQELLWGILAKSRLDGLSRDATAAALALLTPAQILEINGGALGLVPRSLLDSAMGSLPAPLRAVLSAEQGLRDLYDRGGATYDDLARVAVLDGEPPPPLGTVAVPEGRWSLHPDGYYIRYWHDGYTRTTSQLWVPDGDWALSTDDLGRIVRWTGPGGWFVESSYADDVPPIGDPSAPGMQGFAFARVTYGLGEERLVVEDEGYAWVDTGAVARGDQRGGPGARADDEGFDPRDPFGDRRPAARQGRPDVTNFQHYADGLDSIRQGKQRDWIEKHAEAQRKGIGAIRWQLQTGGGDGTFDGEGVSVPGHEQSYRQRIGTTGRSGGGYQPGEVPSTGRGRGYDPDIDR